MENESEDMNSMNCSNRECTIEHDLKSYVTVKMLAVIAFAVMSPIVGLSMYILQDTVSDLLKDIELKIMPLTERINQNTHKIEQIELSQGQFQSNSSEMLNILRDIKTDLKYNYSTKQEVRDGLSKKADIPKGG